jgi:hypothetical protein
MRIVADACRDGESMTMEIACHCVFSAITYDRVFQSVAGENLIRELAERYPKEKILQLSLSRSLLNRGSQQAAQAIAEAVFEEPPREIFRNAETVVAGILSSLME